MSAENLVLSLINDFQRNTAQRRPRKGTHTSTSAGLEELYNISKKRSAMMPCCLYALSLSFCGDFVGSLCALIIFDYLNLPYDELPCTMLSTVLNVLEELHCICLS